MKKGAITLTVLMALLIVSCGGVKNPRPKQPQNPIVKVNIFDEPQQPENLIESATPEQIAADKLLLKKATEEFQKTEAGKELAMALVKTQASMTSPENQTLDFSKKFFNVINNLYSAQIEFADDYVSKNVKTKEGWKAYIEGRKELIGHLKDMDANIALIKTYPAKMKDWTADQKKTLEDLKSKLA